jgi:hypothetical protein
MREFVANQNLLYI